MFKNICQWVITGILLFSNFNNLTFAKEKKISQEGILKYFDVKKIYNGKISGSCLTWQIKNANIIIPKDKFLRITIFYELDGEKNELIQTISSNQQNLNLALNITSNKGCYPHIYLSVANPKVYKKIQLAKRFGLKEANNLTLYTQKIQNFKLNEEYTFATTFNKENFSISKTKQTFCLPTNKIKLLPKVEFKIKLTLTNICQSFSQPRNLSHELADLSLTRRLRYLSKKRELYFKDNRSGLRPLGDINIIQSYLIITTLSMKIAQGIQNKIPQEQIEALKTDLAREKATLAKLQN